MTCAFRNFQVSHHDPHVPIRPVYCYPDIKVFTEIQVFTTTFTSAALQYIVHIMPDACLQMLWNKCFKAAHSISASAEGLYDQTKHSACFWQAICL